MYGVPKDKDTVCLVYNKEMFDQAGVAYPDENWTWDDLTEASQKIYDCHRQVRLHGLLPTTSWATGTSSIRMAATSSMTIRPLPA
ncbi:MAG: extracellular solute-binding protein [Oscillospiraceae bacterium]